MIVYMNGAFLPEEEARVSVSDRGFLLGLGAFETMRAYAGRVFRLQAHLDRLADTLHWLEIPLPRGGEALGRAVVDLLEKQGLSGARVRITVTAGSEENAPGRLAEKITTLVTATPERGLSNGDYDQGVAAVILPCEHGLGLAAGRKVTSYLGCVMARRVAARAGVREALLVGPDGLVVEGAFSNLFLVADGQVWTPPLSSGALPGVTRAVVLELMACHGVSGGERDITVGDLHRADELFVTSSIAEVLPLTRLGDHRIGEGQPGQVTRRLLGLYRQRVTSELAAPLATGPGSC